MDTSLWDRISWRTRNCLSPRKLLFLTNWGSYKRRLLKIIKREFNDKKWHASFNMNTPIAPRMYSLTFIYSNGSWTIAIYKRIRACQALHVGIAWEAAWCWTISIICWKGIFNVTSFSSFTSLNKINKRLLSIYLRQVCWYNVCKPVYQYWDFISY